jgi:hypothetical protein
MLPTIPLLVHHMFTAEETCLLSCYLAADDFSGITSCRNTKSKASIIYQRARHIIFNCEMSEKVKVIIYQTYYLSLLNAKRDVRVLYAEDVKFLQKINDWTRRDKNKH